jgi:hypothetical protein
LDNRQASSFLLPALSDFNRLVKIGIKPAERAPSTSRLKMRSGMRKAA